MLIRVVRGQPEVRTAAAEPVQVRGRPRPGGLSRATIYRKIREYGIS